MRVDKTFPPYYRRVRLFIAMASHATYHSLTFSRQPEATRLERCAIQRYPAKTHLQMNSRSGITSILILTVSTESDLDTFTVSMLRINVNSPWETLGILTTRMVTQCIAVYTELIAGEASLNISCHLDRPTTKMWRWLNKHHPNRHNEIITSLWRQNDVATSFWRHTDVIIASCVRWDVSFSTDSPATPRPGQCSSVAVARTENIPCVT